MTVPSYSLRDDPYWMVAGRERPCACGQSGCNVERGERFFYDPGTGLAYAGECAEREARAWLEDCGLPGGRNVLAMVDGAYDGGLVAFVRDGCAPEGQR